MNHERSGRPVRGCRGEVRARARATIGALRGHEEVARLDWRNRRRQCGLVGWRSRWSHDSGVRERRRHRGRPLSRMVDSRAAPGLGGLDSLARPDPRMQPRSAPFSWCKCRPGTMPGWNPIPFVTFDAERLAERRLAGRGGGRGWSRSRTPGAGRATGTQLEAVGPVPRRAPVGYGPRGLFRQAATAGTISLTITRAAGPTAGAKTASSASPTARVGCASPSRSGTGGTRSSRSGSSG